MMPQPCDVLFIFSGTHPGHWEKAIEAYQKGYAKTIIVTGGRSLTGTAHPDWQGETEAGVIINHLIAAGIPSSSIVAEKQSTNTLENVLYAKKIFDFDAIKSLMFICKSHATGRQWRTLTKHLPQHIPMIPYTFDTAYQETTITRDNWMTTGRSRVWGEYPRICHYGEKGDITPLSERLHTK
ncbi:DUF218 domain [Streptococcus merionis]|uniref:DUF218 domain n=1 Tax=Streptococcus merionis TaxID=400065 RepID=A0A239T253_9STRE|nr:DUF218 domain [Streptococcus merionis]